MAICEIVDVEVVSSVCDDKALQRWLSVISTDVGLPYTVLV